MRERAFYGLIDELIPWAKRPGRALDVGAGNGVLLQPLANAGWCAEGLEPDPEAARAAADSTGLPVLQGDLLTAPLVEGAYDLAVLWHVFEHLAEPVAALERLRRLLTDGGRLVLVYPNLGSLGARAFGADWFPWEPPRHLVLPSRQGLRNAALHAGLAVTSWRTQARHASATFAASRQVRAGRRSDRARVLWRDRALELFERVLTLAGVPVGEETVACLTQT